MSHKIIVQPQKWVQTVRFQLHKLQKMQTNYSDRKQHSSCLGGGRQDGPSDGSQGRWKTLLEWAGPVHSLELATGTSTRTRLHVFNLSGLASVNYTSVTRPLDRDKNVNSAPQAGATSPGEKRKHISGRNSDLAVTSGEKACVRAQNIPSRSFSQ